MGKDLPWSFPLEKQMPKPSSSQLTVASVMSRRERLWERLQRREMRLKLKMMKRKEYQRLRTMVPSIACKPHVSKVTVIEEAVRYIDHLHTALVTKLRTKNISQSSAKDPSSAEDTRMSDDHPNVRDLVHQLMEETSHTLLRRVHEESVQLNLSPFLHSHLERNRLLPSYHLQLIKKT